MVEVLDVSSSPRSPSGSTLRGDGYDVFLSFTGSGNAFTGRLYEALKDRGVETFMDGEKVEELFGYIERSKIFVPVFSKGYADSKWCLKEIAKMVDCRRLIIPVFFDVEPTDVRHQTGLFAPDFEAYRKEGEIAIEEVSEWADALRQAGEMSGYNLADTEGDEAKLIRLIVKRVLTELNKDSLFVIKHGVGLDSRIADVKKVLEVEARDVRMVGIWAMGGMGKTTLAKAVYNQISSCFDVCCFIPNVREAARQSSGLVSLQKQLLRSVCKDETLDITSIDQGIALIKARIERKTILLILDDVDHESQLDALAGGLDWFCTGSRIIVTTRDKGVLRVPRVKEKGIYELKELNVVQSRQLLRWHAFGEVQPVDDFLNLAEEVLITAGGLPLALTIFGSHCFDLETVEEWRIMLERLKEDQDKDIHEKLKISFDALDVKEKEIFLDIACFFIEEKRELATLMWEDCGFFPDISIEVLMHKSLININDATGAFGMNDHIRDMGRKIVQDESVHNPGMCCSRLWEDDQAIDALQNMQGMKNVEAIKFRCRPFEEPMVVEAKPFAAMPQLRMLQLGSNLISECEYELFPKSLKWLQWTLPDQLRSLPACFVHLENIVILDLSGSFCLTQIWNPQSSAGTKVYEKLKVLNLSGCNGLKTCPDISSMPHLEKLYLEDCMSLRGFHPSIWHLKCLTHLSLSGFSSLEELPQTVGELTSLEELRLDGCHRISTLPSELGDLKSLRRLHLSRMHITTLPESICSLSNLEVLNVAYCDSLASLPHSLGNIRSLRELDFSGTSIEELPESMLLLENLKVLRFDNCERLKVSQASVLIRLMVMKIRNGVSSATVGDGELSIVEPSDGQSYFTVSRLRPSEVTELSDPDGAKLDSIAEQLEALDLKDTLWLMDGLPIDESELLEIQRLGIDIHGLLRKRFQEGNYYELLNCLTTLDCDIVESPYARSLYLVLPEGFKRGKLYLILDEFSPVDSVDVHMDITRSSDGRLLFQTSTQAAVWLPGDDDDDNWVNKVPEVKLEWHDDGCLARLVMMRVSVSGCRPVGGYFHRCDIDADARYNVRTNSERFVVLGISCEVHHAACKY